MSFVFSDTSTGLGLLQQFEREIGADPGDVSGNSARLQEFVADTKVAWDRFLVLAIPASGTWQFDDWNHTDYPIITTNIVSAQRDYAFTLDGNSNLILDIHKVLIKDATGNWIEIKPVDVQSQRNLENFQNSSASGVPTQYDKTANGIFFDFIPNYNSSGGLKIYINREPSYFTSADTTKKPGVPGIFHSYFFLKPAADHARRYSLANADRILAEVLRTEQDIQRYFSERPRDERRRITGRVEDTR